MSPLTKVPGWITRPRPSQAMRPNGVLLGDIQVVRRARLTEQPYVEDGAGELLRVHRQEHRQEWLDRQLRAAVRRSPDLAADQLRHLGYGISVPGD
ncbi:MAG: hypothetical protein K1X38_03260 [Microthrixaceae bacterium]|nr:hypothetical protein [Microthrixaceae bacterium]